MLADELDLVDGQQRVAGQQWADVLEAGYILMGDDNTYTVEGQAGRGVDPQDARMGAVGQPRIDMQLVGELQAVVDIHRFAGHVLVGALVPDATTDAGGQIPGKQLGEFGLGFFRNTMVRHKRSPGSRYAAFAVR